MLNEGFPGMVSDLRARAVLVTGGAGFLGTNLTARLLGDGLRVRVLDDFSAPDAEQNAAWLRALGNDRLELIRGDLRDRETVEAAVRGVGYVFHLAARDFPSAALDPELDAQVSVGGTLHLLEALRRQDSPPSLLFASTRAVYGSLEDIVLSRRTRRYEPASSELSRHGIPETRGLDLRSLGACSKGAADQYVLEYARRFGLRAVVLRLGHVCGPHQPDSRENGWVTYLLTRALRGEPLTVHGDGLQVRDLLFVDDLIAAFLAAQAEIRPLSGKAFNVGGGPGNAMSVVELIEVIGRLVGVFPEVRHDETANGGDPKFYVSDNRRFQQATGWRPRVGVDDGLRELSEWIKQSRLGYGAAETPRDHAML